MYKKRNLMPKSWPISRKGAKYIAKPSHNFSKGISVLFIVRNILKIAKTKKEVKYLASNGEIKINHKIRKNINFPVQVFDVISLEKIKKNYRLEIVNRKFQLKEISEKESENKIAKIIGKKIFKGGKVQINLEDGSNFLVDEKFNLGDSVILNTKQNKIEKFLPLKTGANIEVISGKHAGERGKLKQIEKVGIVKRYHVQLKEKEVSLPLKTILVIE